METHRVPKNPAAHSMTSSNLPSRPDRIGPYKILDVLR